MSYADKIQDVSAIYSQSIDSAERILEMDVDGETRSTLEDFIRSPRSNKLIVINENTVKYIYELVRDDEFKSLIVDNWEFAVPFFDKLLFVFPSLSKNSGYRVVFVHRTIDGFAVQPLFSKYDYLQPRELMVQVYGSHVVLHGEVGIHNKIFGEYEEAKEAEILDTSAHISYIVIVIFLLIYKRPEYIREVPATHRMVGNKRVPYAAHKTIDLGLFEPKEVYTMFAPPKGSHASPRAHEVIGHWMHRNVDRTCTHNWVKLEPSEDDPRPTERENGKPYLRYVCTHCGGLRSFREAHIRGDASKGFITHDYEA